MHPFSLKTFTVALVAVCVSLTAGAQTDAERAQQKAREAAEKAAEARRKASIEAAKAGLRPIFSKEAERRARIYEKQRSRLMRSNRVRRSETSDSIVIEEIDPKLKTWRQKFYVGAQIASNYAVADNVTDHPPFRWSEVFGIGANAYVGYFFPRAWGLRASVSYQNVRNRVDRETVNGHWQYYGIYSGKGFYSFDVLETNADLLFDISGASHSKYYHPFHAYVILGTGLSMLSKKRLRGGLLVPDERNEKGFIVAPYRQYDAEGNVVKERKVEHPSFENRVHRKARALWCARAGFQIDYRVTKSLSVNAEASVQFYNDNYDGINYDEPIDFLLKASVGTTIWF